MQKPKFSFTWPQICLPQKSTKNIAIAVGLILVLFIGYRIYANLSANRDRAARALAGRTVTVEVAAVQKRDIVPTFTFAANLEPVWSADVSPKADGRIDKLLVDEGDIIKVGTVLAVLDTNELEAQVLQAEGSLLSAKATYEQYDLLYKRMAALYDQGGVSAQTVDTARTNRDLASGSVKAAQGNYMLLVARLDNARILSPLNGVVTKRYIQAGTFAKAGTAIFSVGDVSTMLTKATVGEAEISQLKLGTLVKIKVAALGDREFQGTITRLSPAATLPARTFTAEISIPNTEGVLKPGMFAQAFAQGQLKQQVLSVPDSALVLREDQQSVFILVGDNKVQQKVLSLGSAAGGFIEVLSGLSPTDRIVVAGQHKLRDGAMVRIGGPGEGEK